MLASVVVGMLCVVAGCVLTQAAYTAQSVEQEEVEPLALLERGEGKAIGEAARRLAGLVESGSMVVRGGKSQAVDRFEQAQAWLFEEAKKGRTIQRFKGLGEMNPEQLWETTVNPETRRALQVRIEDAAQADALFSMLMGDQVAPRREFIEDNALRVQHLDV